MQFARQYPAGLAKYSYVASSDQEWVVVNPTRDIEVCVAQAKASRMGPIPAFDFRHVGEAWDRKEPLAMLCNTSNRPMLSSSLLEPRAFRKLISTLEDIPAWKFAYNPLINETEAM